jgi:hypothetical protein
MSRAVYFPNRSLLPLLWGASIDNIINILYVIYTVVLCILNVVGSYTLKQQERKNDLENEIQKFCRQELANCTFFRS